MEHTIHKYEVWAMENVYDFKADAMGNSTRYLKEMKKIGDGPLRYAHIEQHQADTLNHQAENLGEFYYKIETE